MSAKEGNGQMLESLKVSTRVLNDYITKEIFEFLSEKEQEFLIETSILSYFNQNICEKFHPDIDFSAMMESILQKNLLVINVDESAGIYRYHAILAEYLKGLFDKQDLEQKENLHSQAATIFAELGDYEESLHHLFRIHAYERIMKLILKMPQTAMTFSFLMKVPMEEIVKNADFAYQYFFYYYASTDEAVSKKIYQFIKSNMKDEQTFEAFQFANLFFSDALDFQRANPLTLEQIQSLPLNDITTAFLLIKEAYFLYANSNFKEAINYLNYAGDVYKKTGNIYIGIFVLSEKAQIYEDMGELGLCFDLYREMRPMIEQIKSLASSYYIGIAGVYIRQMSLDLAYEMLEKAKDGIAEDSVSIGRAYQYTLAEYCYLTGETDLTEKMLIDIMGQEAYDNVAYSARLLRYPLYRGKHMELAKRFLESYHENDSLVDNMDGQLLYASIQYETGDYETALELVDTMIARSRKMQNKLKIIECDLLKARMLLDNEGERRDIQNLFVEAVSYAMEDGIAHPFWFEKNTVSQIVSEMKTELNKELSKEESNFVASILSSDSKHGISPKRRTNEAMCEDLLTEREKEVLQELAAGSTNMQIAEKLCVSLATVKTHINNIYGKLGVNNRVAAVNAIKANRWDWRVDNSLE
jgi:LuxR family maltose regulon positive regulatory protein